MSAVEYEVGTEHGGDRAACAEVRDVWPVRISAYVFLGFWFLYQLIEANFGLFSTGANGGGVAFFAHGGFVFGVLVTIALLNAGRVQPQDYNAVVGTA